MHCTMPSWRFYMTYMRIYIIHIYSVCLIMRTLWQDQLSLFGTRACSIEKRCILCAAYGAGLWAVGLLTYYEIKFFLNIIFYKHTPHITQYVLYLIFYFIFWRSFVFFFFNICSYILEKCAIMYVSLWIWELIL